ncbi:MULTISPECIES: TetR/AcrR family transcriptional regulator [unclassified Luteococcus]|uniref:TetR/AcrR family transcriptional regulator n=1 Tax=unclassified Luteococcus TaxID=2639923 RepID=UPI00313DEAEB
MASITRRTQIRTAAIQLFDERGYYGAGMEDIARALGMRASSLYNHYSSKQEVLGEISLWIHQELLRQYDESLAGLANPRDKVVAAMRNHARFHAEHAAPVRVSNREVKALQEPYASQVRQLRRDYVQHWIDLINEGVATGDFTTPDAKIVAYFIIDMGTGVSQWYKPDGRQPLDVLCDFYANAALRLLRTDMPDAR